jgi:hypothetical protein
MLWCVENVAVQLNSLEAENAEHHRYSPPPGELVEGRHSGIVPAGGLA